MKNLNTQTEMEINGTKRFYGSNPYRTLSQNEILAELAESRICYARGEGEDFNEVFDELAAKYAI